MTLSGVTKMNYKLNEIKMPNHINYLHSISAILDLYIENQGKKYPFEMDSQIKEELKTLVYELFAYAVKRNSGEEILFRFEIKDNKFFIDLEIDSDEANLLLLNKQNTEHVNGVCAIPESSSKWSNEYQYHSISRNDSTEELNSFVILSLADELFCVSDSNGKSLLLVTKSINGETK